MQGVDFWEDQKNAQEVSQKVAVLKEEAEVAEMIKKEWQDLKELSNLSDNGEDLQKLYDQLIKKVEKEEFKAFLSGKYDKKNALLEIFSGAGGQDAQDWATMLLRMYQRYADKKGFKTQVLHQSFF